MHHRVDRTYAHSWDRKPLAYSLPIREPDGGDARRNVVLNRDLRRVMPAYVARRDKRDGIRQLGFRDAAGDDLLGVLTGRQVGIADFDPGHLPGNLKSRPCERPTQHLLWLMEVCEQEPVRVGEGKRKAGEVGGALSGYLIRHIFLSPHRLSCPRVYANCALVRCEGTQRRIAACFVLD